MKIYLILVTTCLFAVGCESARSSNPNCNFSNPKQRIEGGYPGITQKQCEALGSCYDDTTPNVIWCFRENTGRSRNPKCNFSNPKQRINGGWSGISKNECESLGNCFDDTIPNVVWCIKTVTRLPSQYCDFQNPQKRVEGGFAGITREQCVANGSCFDDSIPNVKWCFRENTGRSRNPKCNFSNPKQRINGGWSGISKNECESLGNCFDDTIPNVVWCIKTVPPLSSRYCDFQNPKKRVEGGFAGITREQCVAKGSCFDDSTPNVKWCFRENSGRTLNPKCNFANPTQRVNGGWAGITKNECESLGYCFDNTIPNVVWCIKTVPRVSSSFCDFQNPKKRVEGGFAGITREQCVANGNCFDDSIPNVKWCFKYNK